MQFYAANVMNVLNVAVFSGSDDGMLEDLDVGCNCWRTELLLHSQNIIKLLNVLIFRNF